MPQPMRVLVYNPSYTIDRDPTSLRLTSLTNCLGIAGWQFDIVTSPVFFRGDQSQLTRLRQIHRTLPHLRVFVTSPGLVASLRWRLHLSRQSPRGTVLNDPRAPSRGSPHLSRLLRLFQTAYDRIFSRIGDPDWVLPATIQGVRLLASTSYHVIFASGSSYFASYIAAAIVSTVFRIPLVLDYVDPWTGDHAGITPRWPRRLDWVLEGQVLRIAREVIVTNERAREGLLDRYPALRPDQVQVISQGYTAVAPPESASPLNDTGSVFTVAYTGTFYPRLQSPMELLKALRWTSDRGLRIRFIHAGQKIADEDARRAREEGVDKFIEYVGDLPHEDAVALQRRATVLLVVGTQSRDQIPGKVIEYIGARRPILCLSAGSHDLAAQFVRRHGLGIVVADRAVDIQQGLVNLYHWWQEGDLETVAYHPHDVEAFSWQSLAGRLQNAFLHHCDSPGSEYRARELEVPPLGRRG